MAARGGGTRTLGPLIEPVSYAGSYFVAISWFDQASAAWRGRPRKLTELDRPHCQVLTGEVINHVHAFDWFFWVDRDRWSWEVPRSPSNHQTDAREAHRHYGGRDPNRNGANWWFADGHVKWHSVTSVDKLFCCQDFGSPRPGWRWDLQEQRCAGRDQDTPAGGGRRSGR